MAAGFPINKGVIDNRIGFLAKQLRDTLRDIQAVKTWLDGITDAELEGMGYSTDDVALIKSAYGDLAKLARIANAQDVQVGNSDFFFWAKRLTALD